MEVCRTGRNSPTGKLVQIEHALIAVGSGQTSLGIKAANGVVIATEKKLPSILVDESSSVGPAGRGMFHIPLYCILLTLDCISYLPFILSNAAVIYLSLSLNIK
ncbi:hypothetical protein NC651_029162 [Populus alba x Populus x berolinensis]|nr:hypothetical protein NC651_029162 [Populus alba x Populus x berolinensis]